MNGPLTIADIVALLAIASAVGGLWWRIEAAISKVRDDGAKRVDHLSHALAEQATALADYKTEVAKDYARNGYLRDVEERVLKRIGEVVTEIHGLRSEIGEAVKAIVSPSKRSR